MNKNKVLTWALAMLQGISLMAISWTGKRLIDLGERVVKLETRVDNANERIQVLFSMRRESRPR